MREQAEYGKPCWWAALINNFAANERKVARMLTVRFVAPAYRLANAKDFAKRRQHECRYHSNPLRRMLDVLRRDRRDCVRVCAAKTDCKPSPALA